MKDEEQICKEKSVNELSACVLLLLLYYYYYFIIIIIIIIIVSVCNNCLSVLLGCSNINKALCLFTE